MSPQTPRQSPVQTPRQSSRPAAHASSGTSSGSSRASSNTTNRTRLARALAAETGIGYQKCLQVVAGIAEAGLLPTFGAHTLEETVDALAPLALLTSTKSRPRARTTTTPPMTAPHSTTPHSTAPVSPVSPVLGRPASYDVFADGGLFDLAAFSPHAAVTRNRPPGVAITGEPGFGKSFLALALARRMTKAGVRTIYLDPKADALPLLAVPGLEKAKALHLRDAQVGMLNPYALAADVNEASLLALETLRLLLGDDALLTRTASTEEALVAALNHVATESNPSLGRVVDVLLATTDSPAYALGLRLDLMRQLPFAHLCFGERTGRAFVPADGLTMVTALGLDLPSGDTDPLDYSYEQRLGSSVMYLLTEWAHRVTVATERSVPCAILLDEAWSVTATAQGARLIKRVGRVTRSTNTALVLITHRAQDLLPVSGFISTVFGFRATNGDDVAAVRQLLGAGDVDGAGVAVRDLRTGECLVRELDGDITRVQIVRDPDLMEAFSGNPSARERQRAALDR